MFISIEQRTLLTSTKFIKQKEYWTDKLSGIGETAALKGFGGDKVEEPEVMPPGKKSIEIPLTGDTCRKLIKLGNQSAPTIYVILLSCLKVLLYRYSGEMDILALAPVFEADKTADTMNNLLVIRNGINDETTFKQVLMNVGRSFKEACENQDYPLDELLNFLFKEQPDRKERVISGIVCALENIHDYGSIEDSIPGNNPAFLFRYSAEAGSIGGSISFNPDMWDSRFIQQVSRHYSKITEALLNHIDREIAAISYLSDEETKQLLYDFNQPETAYPRDKTIHHLFEEEVKRNPHAMALIYEDLQVTYGEVEQASNRMAHELIQNGVQPHANPIVGIMIDPSIEMITGIFGILKSGAAYLPIDPELPEGRIRFMLKDSQTKIIVTNGLKVDWMDGLRVIRPGDADQFPNHQTNKPSNQPTNLSYVIYTSGSTGKPKGVLTTHYNVTRVVLNTNYIELTKNDRVLQWSNVAFDGSVFDIYGALLNGGALVLPQGEKITAVDRLADVITRQSISIFFVTTAFFNLLVDLRPQVFDNIRKVLFGGERVSLEHTRRALENSAGNKIIHVYGPTETTVYATWYPVKMIAEGASTVPIGKALSNTTVYILDKSLKPVPIGVAGEIFIGGPGVARGYLNRPELTAERFINYKSQITNKTFAKFAVKLYKTGDLARWLPDGNIEFIGRTDHQVKMRGFRIELGEIESQLIRFENVKDAVVIDMGEQGSEKYLCAYYIPAEGDYVPIEGDYVPVKEDIVTGDETEVTAIRDWLSKYLPNFMVPSHFIKLEKIPLTPNGKVDRKALPEPELISGETYRAPRDVTETQMVALWAGVLGRDDAHESQLQTSIGINDNFFQLGGHSLKAVLLISGMHQAFNVKVPLSEFFRVPTIAGVSHYVREAVGDFHISLEPCEKKEYYPLSSAQRRLYILHRMDETGTGYNIPVMFILEGRPDQNRLEDAFHRLIKRHESFRTSFKTVGDQTVQEVNKEVEFDIRYFDEAYDEAMVEESYASIINGFVRPFDLSHAPLLRVGLIKRDEKRHILMLDMHHIISDGSSCGIIAGDFMALYSGETLPPLHLQYNDYSEWQKGQMESEEVKKQEEYWLKQFAGEIPVLDLPTDYERPSALSFEGGRVNFQLPRETRNALMKLALESGTTLYMVLFTLYSIFLSKLTGQEDIVIGTASAGRNHADLKTIVGMFVNTMGIRTSPSGRKITKEFLEEVRHTTLTAFENQDYQYDRLVEQVAGNRDAAHNPLFSTLLVLQNIEAIAIEIPGLKLIPYDYEIETAKFDLMLMAQEGDEAIRFIFEYSSKLFKPETIRRFVNYFRTITSSFLENRDKTIAD
ncbi:MAG: amino acid adenylation domain-containing protein, partial [bacterium]|nr:amino acid adenylation domain-containing protein [bacterium]